MTGQGIHKGHYNDAAAVSDEDDFSLRGRQHAVNAGAQAALDNIQTLANGNAKQRMAALSGNVTAADAHQRPSRNTSAAVSPASGSGDDGERVYDWVTNYLNENTETPEVRRRRERMESRHGMISGIGDTIRALSNLYFTTRYSPDGYDAGKSATTQHSERMERARRQRDADRNYYLNYALNMGNIKFRDAAVNEQKKQAEQAQQNWKEKLEADRQSRAATLAYNAMKDRLAMQEKQADRDSKERMEEARRKNDRVVASIRSNSKGSSGNVKSVPLGDGSRVEMSGGDYNSSNAAHLNALLPEGRRAKGKPIYVKNEVGEKVVDRYQSPTINDMWAAVQRYLTDTSVPESEKKEIRKRIKTYGPSVGSAGTPTSSGVDNNTPPSRRASSGSDNDNTPPSRR